ncbi:MAG: hypothetical protein HY902_10830, partial [Deltaproteobacteria bacterium]|nr:hypothetical protein [Deltaproteobacteria bacterium]
MTQTMHKGGWLRPALAEPLPGEPPGLRQLSAAAAWQQGQDAEQMYDFEAARHLYRQAVRATPARQALEASARYAEFLVERLGDLAEVAGWLDEPDFALVSDAKGAARDLTRLVAHAAAGVQHPRATELDRRLAGQGDAQALLR